MKLLAGLGNPGAQYAMTRHNLGFMIIDVLHDELAGDQWRNKFQGHISGVQCENEKHLLLKPLTYMNLSGNSIQQAKVFYKIENQDVIVFHDDVDLELGKVKIKRGGGDAGHNGLKSITTQIGSDYWRVRLGVGRPTNPAHSTADWVLGTFSKFEQDELITLAEQFRTHVSTFFVGEYQNLCAKINH